MANLDKKQREPRFFDRPAFWFCVLVPLVFLLIVFIPPTRHVFLDLTARYPYPLAFFKFALLATVGETIAHSLGQKKMQFPKHPVLKAVVWGIIGILIALMFPLYTAGVKHAQSLSMLPGKNSGFLTALLVSVLLNVTFGVVMMAGHRISDKAIDRTEKNVDLISSIDWSRFIKVVVFRTIPLFWVPAHTITFLLPEGFRVIWSALLSIALGLILALTTPRQV